MKRSILKRTETKGLKYIKARWQGAFMQDDDVIGALHEVVDEMIDRKAINYLARYLPPFDFEKPNEHDSKKAFLAEKRQVESAIKHSDALIAQMATRDETLKPAYADLRRRIDQHASKKVRSSQPTQSIDLVIKNMVDVGLSFSTLMALFEIRDCFLERRKELLDQEKEFWTVSSRPPNYYARTISLRMARLYAKEKGEFPTFGTSRDGGHPSTKFGRAVEEAYRILGIDADIRSPTDWALKQLTEDDLKTEKSMFGSLFAMPDKPGIANQAILDALEKRSRD